VNEMPPEDLALVYGVIREAVANAAKHADVAQIQVRVKAGPGALEVSVRDGGRGFSSEDERAARSAHHVGLEFLRRRVSDAGGELTVETGRGSGTEVLARIPYASASR
jgi:signal transduction histidine kinase